MVQTAHECGYCEYGGYNGFVNTFIGKDNLASSVFHIKSMTEKRNNTGANILQAGKRVIMDHVNNILKMAQQPFSFDEHNSVDITQIAFAGMVELLLRKYNDELVNNKTWMLRPEQAIIVNIGGLSKYKK